MSPVHLLRGTHVLKVEEDRFFFSIYLFLLIDDWFTIMV